jgi:hypothetical protein
VYAPLPSGEVAEVGADDTDRVSRDAVLCDVINVEFSLVDGEGDTDGVAAPSTSNVQEPVEVNKPLACSEVGGQRREDEPVQRLRAGLLMDNP